jgi:hypothetical protein
MNFSTLAPFIASIIRHALVAGGLIELSKADDTSNQLASSFVTLAGIAWSFYNAHKANKSNVSNTT